MLHHRIVRENGPGRPSTPASAYPHAGQRWSIAMVTVAHRGQVPAASGGEGSGVTGLF
jgi:hypothetical protein